MKNFWSNQYSYIAPDWIMQQADYAYECMPPPVGWPLMMVGSLSALVLCAAETFFWFIFTPMKYRE